ncbi:hypothetical protein N0V94_002993 [Neodidymelliopsis sp. IMI 364377]|nr:hypothetical protein N0V94_002993 [Neodidymelliopsis sp. IMI 364377]
MSQWSPQLRSNARLIMQDSRPAVGLYGPDLIMIYNEAYIELLGGLHPCMGRDARTVLASVWETHFEHIIQQNLVGEIVTNDNTEVPLVRNGYVEETYFSVRFIPIFDSEGSTIGHYEPVIETTKEVILERRSRTLLELSQEIPQAHDSDSYWDHAIQAEDNKKETDESNKSASKHYHYALRGSIGTPNESPAGLIRFDSKEDHGFVPYFKQALIARQPIVMNPRRPYDQDYSQFVLVANRVLSASLASIILHEEDIRRREHAISTAEIIKSDLRKQLLESQKAADRNHAKFTRFAERSDIGIFVINMEGVYTYRNDAWYTILNPDDRDLDLEDAWGALVDDEYIAAGQDRFGTLMETKQHQ